jgi:hypothetical protein
MGAALAIALLLLAVAGDLQPYARQTGAVIEGFIGRHTRG